MVKTQIISVGKIKERSTQDLISEYQKRLSKYTAFESNEVKDLALPDNPSEKEIEAVLKKEAESIMKLLPKGLIRVAMTINGRQYASEEFAEFIEKNKQKGGICFIIGSSHGLHKSVTDACDTEVSLSKMTLPHNLARLILTEQIYRGFKILSNENYHK